MFGIIRKLSEEPERWKRWCVFSD